MKTQANTYDLPYKIRFNSLLEESKIDNSINLSKVAPYPI